jgi:hypothetical protein
MARKWRENKMPIIAIILIIIFALIIIFELFSTRHNFNSRFTVFALSISLSLLVAYELKDKNQIITQEQIAEFFKLTDPFEIKKVHIYTLTLIFFLVFSIIFMIISNFRVKSNKVFISIIEALLLCSSIYVITVISLRTLSNSLSNDLIDTFLNSKFIIFNNNSFWIMLI